MLEQTSDETGDFRTVELVHEGAPLQGQLIAPGRTVSRTTPSPTRSRGLEPSPFLGRSSRFSGGSDVGGQSRFARRRARPAQRATRVVLGAC